MSTTTSLAEVFPPGEYIRDELSARQWTQQDLAQILGRPIQAVNEIINGKKTVTPETAIGLGSAFGTSAAMWLNLQNQWSLYETEKEGFRGESTRSRALLREVLPVNDMIKRGWLPDTSDATVLEQAACEFMGVAAINDELPFLIAARRSGEITQWTPKQKAWLCRVRNVAETLDSQPFDPDVAAAGIPDLVHMSLPTENVSAIPERLAALGIRFVAEPSLPGSKMDGAAFWVETTHPVVAVSIRYDRNDHFWFTLLHELAHIVLGHTKPDDPPTVDDEDVAGDPQKENDANSAASAWILGGASDDGLPHDLPSILAWAEERRIHPGLVVGRLHHIRERGGQGIPYNRFRQTLVKVRHLLETPNSIPSGTSP